MWSFSIHAPIAVLGLAAIAQLPLATAKPYPVHIEFLREAHNATQLERRDCGAGGIVCGYYSQLCCYNGEGCGEDANNQAVCVAAGAAATGWVTYTTTWVETVGLVTKTSVWSSYAGAAATATATSCGDTRSPCGGGVCCDAGYYCFAPESHECRLIGGSSSPGVTGTVSPSAPLRPTSSTLIVITATGGTPTATQPFETPIPTGANGTLVPVPAGGGGGLSGGAIAGIVIGSILGALLLLLICLYCCARAIFDTVLACFGLGKKNRRHTHEETYIEEHHHSHGSAAAGASGRRWYGQSSRPSRQPKKSGGLGGALGMGAALGGLALALGLKRKHDRKHDDKSTTISGSSAYYSDYTSSSSASSSDRRSRPTRHSSRRG